MQAIVLSIGDELVLGQTVDTNSAFLSAELARLGIGTRYHQTVADDAATIADAIRRAAAAAPLVLISGGLGPTEDDLTRQSLAEAMGVDLVLHEPSVRAIADRFARYGRPMPKRNQVQAMYPRTSTMIPNDCGTAPGIKANLDEAVIYVTPGVPSELYAMFEKAIRPELEQLEATRHVILTVKINTFGLGESTVTQKLGDLTDRQRNPLVGTTVSDAVVSVRVRSEFADANTAGQQLDRTVEVVERRLGAAVFGRGDQTIQQSLVELLKERQLTVATAESCTGGMLGQMITDVAGASEVYAGGWITYSNELKIDLGVDEALIETDGAVSQPVARELARCAAVQSGADLGVSITGIAGPDGGSVEKPVGTIWVAVASRPNGRSDQAMLTEALQLHLLGDRRQIRDRAGKSAAQMLRLLIVGASLEELSFGRRAGDSRRSI